MTDVPVPYRSRPPLLRSAPLIALMMLLSAVALPVACRGSTSSALEVPIEDWFGRPVVALTIANDGPFRFILDTGAGITVIDNALAERLSLKFLGEDEVGSPLGGKVPAQRLRLPQARLPGIDLGDVDGLAIDLAGVIGGGDSPVGVLASNAFAGRSLTFDFPRHQIRVADHELPPTDKLRVFDFCAAGGKPSLRVLVGGAYHCVNVDTGSPALLALPLSIADSLPLKSAPTEQGRAVLVGAEVSVWGALLDGELRIGEIALKEPMLTFHETAGFGNLGQGFLRFAELTIDHSNERLSIRATQEARQTGPQPRRVVRSRGQKRYGIRFRGIGGADLVVTGVDAGSVAAAGGVRDGDRIVRLNGSPVSGLSTGDRIAAMQNSPLRLTLSRDGAIREVLLQLD